MNISSIGNFNPSFGRALFTDEEKKSFTKGNFPQLIEEQEKNKRAHITVEKDCFVVHHLDDSGKKHSYMRIADEGILGFLNKRSQKAFEIACNVADAWEKKTGIIGDGVDKYGRPDASNLVFGTGNMFDSNAKKMEQRAKLEKLLNVSA